MRGILLAVMCFSGLCLAADPAVRPIVPAISGPNSLVVTKPLPTLRSMKFTQPPVVVKPSQSVAGTKPPANPPGPMDAATLQQTYLSPSGLILSASAMRDTTSMSEVILSHCYITSKTADVFQGTGGAHTLNYTKSIGGSYLVEGFFNHMPAGSHEYILALYATHLDGALKDQITVRIGATMIPAANITTLGDGAICINFLFDPAGSDQGNVLPVGIDFALKAGESPATNHTMYFSSIQLLMVK